MVGVIVIVTVILKVAMMIRIRMVLWFFIMTLMLMKCCTPHDLVKHGTYPEHPEHARNMPGTPPKI
jgi:hypothetical protein